MNNTIYDVFISYRRDGGGATAGRINDMLMADGYSVSYDINTLREGRFDTKLLERIEQCQDFILVVDKNCFVRTIDPATDPQEDWLWRELAYAIKLKKNIIPVLMTGASFPKQLPDDINEVRNYNGPQCIHEYFEDFYKKLRDFLHAYPRMARSPSQKLSYLKIKADMDCVFYLDGEEQAHLKAGVIKKFPLAKGEYELKFVSVDNSNDSKEIDFEMPEIDKLIKVSLSSIRDTRLQKEAETKRIGDEKRIAEKKRGEAEKAISLLEERRLVEKKRREEEARIRERIFTVSGISFKMIRVEGGGFYMGASKSDTEAWSDETPKHWVRLDDYYIGETQVTQALWEAVMSNIPSTFTGENNPVEFVSWDDCQKFIMKLNVLLENQIPRDYRFSLPTEAQWEFAARGGRKSNHYKYAGSNTLSEVAWYDNNSGGVTHPVKEKNANELVLYDMSGNVKEWCMDWYSNTFYSNSPKDNPQGSPNGSSRVLRGGGRSDRAQECRVTYRELGSPKDSRRFYGFRLALVHK